MHSECEWAVEDSQVPKSKLLPVQQVLPGDAQSVSRMEGPGGAAVWGFIDLGDF